MIVYAVDTAGAFRRVNVFAARLVWAVNAPGYFEFTTDAEQAGVIGLSRLHTMIYVLRDGYGRVLRGYPDEITFSNSARGSAVTISGVGALGLFARRVVYGEKKFEAVAADDAIKALLREALLRDGTTLPVTIEPNTGSAPATTLDCSWRDTVLDAVNDITDTARGLYVFSIDDDASSNIVTRYITSAPTVFDGILAVESGTASEVSYTIDHTEGANVVYGVGRKQSGNSVITVGPFTLGTISLLTRREVIHDNPSEEVAAELESEARAKLCGPRRSVSVVTSKALRLCDAVLIRTIVGNVAAVVTAAEYTWPDDTMSYTLEVLDA